MRRCPNFIQMHLSRSYTTNIKLYSIKLYISSLAFVLDDKASFSCHLPSISSNIPCIFLFVTINMHIYIYALLLIPYLYRMSPCLFYFAVMSTLSPNKAVTPIRGIMETTKLMSRQSITSNDEPNRSFDVEAGILKLAGTFSPIVQHT